jgi:hypothetical protein
VELEPTNRCVQCVDRSIESRQLYRPEPKPAVIVAPTPQTLQVVYAYGFNQDASCVAVGTSKGYAIYNCEVRACVWGCRGEEWRLH